MNLSTSKKIILISLIILIGVIILLSIIYRHAALWEPEQHLITLLPKSPICYLTLKEMKGLVQTFNRSALGKQTVKIPLLAEIEKRRWWKQLVYQKQLWEYEMGGRLDLKTIIGYFGEETILAIYQREGEFSFLIITAVGAQEKLSIEAITAADPINPTYERTQNDYREFTINTITGYPRNFSYTFIGKIGILSLDPLLIAETIDIYSDGAAKATQNSQGFIAGHPMSDNIQQDYRDDKSTGYVDVNQLPFAIDRVSSNALIKQIHGLFGDAEFWAFSHRYEDNVIISRHHLHKRAKTYQPTFPSTTDAKPFFAFPERTAFVTSMPVPHQIVERFSDVDLSQVLGTNLTALLIASEPDDISVVPSLVLLAHTKAPDALKSVLDIVKQGKISIAGQYLEYLEPQDYKGVKVQPIQLRLNFLMAVTGGYAIFDDYFVLSTTLAGVKSVVDIITGNAPTLTVPFSADSSSHVQTFIQPELFVPELKRFLPMATTFLSFSGQKLDTTLRRRLTDNLFPLESLGPISAEVNLSENSIDAEVRIVLEK